MQCSLNSIITLLKGILSRRLIISFCCSILPLSAKESLTPFLLQLQHCFGKALLEEVLDRKDLKIFSLLHQITPLTNKQKLDIIKEIYLEFSDQLTSYFQGRIHDLFLNFPEGLMKERLEILNHLINNLTHPIDRAYCYFELYRILAYIKDIPRFAKGNFLEKRSKLLKLHIELLKQKEQFIHISDPGLYNYQLQFLFKIQEHMQPPFPKPAPFNWLRFFPGVCIYTKESHPDAVFKFGDQNNKENAIWELSCLFRLDNSIPSCMPVFINGIKGCLQEFEYSDISQHSDQKILRMINPHSYFTCALLILLFALNDIHEGNMYCRISSTRDYEIGIFDLESSFSKYLPNHFTKNLDNPFLKIPFNWIGWDFPQATKQVPLDNLLTLQSLVAQWDEMIPDIITYLDHPLSQLYLTDEEKEYFLARIGTLRDLILYSPNLSPLNWLITLFPTYHKIAEKIKSRQQILPAPYRYEGVIQTLYRFGWNKTLVPEYQNMLIEWFQTLSETL